MNYTGLIIGAASFIIIGAFHPIIIKCEYYFTYRIWSVFLVFGVMFLTASCFVSHFIISSVLAILGCTCLWSIIELKKQKERVEKGWFPKNEKND
ncbi:MAG: DUF4491 family protein [Eubacteriales bacterium]|nr:DUF4491 family protein [Eubacteriales bacterium]